MQRDLPGLSWERDAGFDDPPQLTADASDPEKALETFRRVRDEIRQFVEQLPATLEAGTAEQLPATLEAGSTEQQDANKGLGFFERYLTVWVLLCILGGIGLGKVAPSVATYLDGLATYVGDAPVVSIPIAICLFLMMFPIMVKIDFTEVVRAGRSTKPVGLTLFVNWAVKPFIMYAIAAYFLGTVFSGSSAPRPSTSSRCPSASTCPLEPRTAKAP